MTATQKHPTVLDEAGSDLFDFAIDRDDVKWLLARIPEAAGVRHHTVEYELQILKIITVGWSIAFCLCDHPLKNDLSERFWAGIREFSGSIRQTTEMMTGQDVDYFRILRQRLDTYVAALANNPETPEPAAVIGPTFAFVCGDVENVHVTMAGSKLFATAFTRVKGYLGAVEL